jgi:MTH538 TIR-like domain (DUF1863).
MARYVFFSFDYEDVKNFKVNVVRNSWLINNSQSVFIDGSIWESEKSKGADVIKDLIADGLSQTSVTAVLIGENTYSRRWVKYEIVKSFEKGNGLFAVHINRIKGRTGLTARGLNPFDKLGFEISNDGKKISFFELINRHWYGYADLPMINNKKTNSLHFTDHWWSGNEFGKFFRFSEKFPTYCWDFDEGHPNFSGWTEIAVKEFSKFRN